MMKTIEDIYYEAFLTRDPKFDGKFFLGVKTTGIYCRPICPAKPKRNNILFFASALHAEKAGYRPCLRCRPESAPDSPAWHGSSDIVKRAILACDDEAALTLNEDEFAAQFSITARHLRRIFTKELGKTPAQIIHNQRLNLARKLIVETDLPFIDIAFSAGFNSVRRFNEAIKNRFTKTPTDLRKRKSYHEDNTDIKLSVAYRPPLDWEGCLAYYEKHKIGNLEQFENGTYTRIFRFEQHIGMVSVKHNPHQHQLLITLKTRDINAIGFVLRRIKEMFDLSLDPVYVSNAFQAVKSLEKVTTKGHGTRLVRCWDRFELAITTILGQLISIKHATQLTEKLIELYGHRQINPFTGKEIILFPTPKTLAQESLTALKIPQTKKQAIIALAQAVVSEAIHFSSYQDPHTFKAKLQAIRGIGKWTAEYIALRAIGDTDAFPEGDAYLDKCIDTQTIKLLSPWRGYLASYLYKYGVKL